MVLGRHMAASSRSARSRMTYLLWLQRATVKQLTICAVAAAALAVSLVVGDATFERFHAGDFFAGFALAGAIAYAALAYRAWRRG